MEFKVGDRVQFIGVPDKILKDGETYGWDYWAAEDELTLLSVYTVDEVSDMISIKLKGTQNYLWHHYKSFIKI